MFGWPALFRMRSNEMSVEECFEFCLSKGLDLFGLVKGAECRCGASRLNSGVWRSADPRPGMELADSDKIGSCATDGACPLRVYRWLGPFVSGGSVPEHLMMPRLEDSVLVDSVVKGRLLNEGDERMGQEEACLMPRMPRMRRLNLYWHSMEGMPVGGTDTAMIFRDVNTLVLGLNEQAWLQKEWHHNGKSM